MKALNNAKFEEMIKERLATLICNLAKATKDNEKQFEHFASVERFLVREIALAKGENALKALSKE